MVLIYDELFVLFVLQNLNQILIKEDMNSYLRRVVLLSLLSMLYAAISNANLGIISQFASQNGNEWIGPLSIALVFLGSGCGAIYNKYIGKQPYRWIIFIGSMGWNIFLSFSVMFLFIGFSNFVIVMIMVGSLGCGLLMSGYYNGLNNYINECGKRDDKLSSYFGINICINQTSNIIGNALSALLIQPLGQKTYSFVMLGFSLLLSSLFLLVRDFPEEASEQKSILQNDKEGLQSCIQTQTNTKRVPLLLFFVFAFSGIMISFVYSELSITFYSFYPDEQKEALNKLTFVTFMIEGFGEFLGGLTLGLFASRLKKMVIFNLSNSILFILGVLLMWQGFEGKQEWAIQLTAFFIGFADCFGFASALSIAGKWDQSGISLFNFGQSFTVAMLSTVYIFLDVPYTIIIYGVYLVMATMASWKYRAVIDNESAST